MDRSRATRILAVATLALLVLIAILWLWPSGGPAAPEAVTTVTQQAPAPGGAAASAAGATAAAEVAEGPTESELPHPTKYCTTIVDWHRRNVPPFVIEDNMMAQGMKFDEADLACLTAGGLPPQILDFAEQNTRRPQPPSTPRPKRE